MLIHSNEINMLQSAEMEVLIEEKMYKEIQPFIFMGRILGLAPIACRKIGNKHNLKISNKYIFYSYILGLLLAGSALYCLVSDFNASTDESLRIKDTKGAYVVSCDIGLMVFIVILGIFISPFKLGKFFRIVDSLQHVETRMNLRDQEHSRKVFFLVSSVSLLLFFCVLTYDFIAWYIKTKGLPAAPLIWKNIPLYLLYIVSFSQEIAYWHMTFFLKRCFVAFNKNFKGNGQTMELKTKKAHLELRKQFLVKNLHQVNQRKLTISTSWKLQKRLTADRVENLIHIFRTLFNTINLINEWYEIPLLFILLSCLFQLIGTPYFIITNTKSNILAFSILEILWLFTHASRLLIIVEASHQCIKEYNKINFLLCSHLRMDYDKETAQQLKVLSQHIKTCKMGFSTYGITELNRSILASITGAVTTYLVVLVQLKTHAIGEKIKLPYGNSST